MTPLEPVPGALATELRALQSIYAVGKRHNLSVASHKHYGPKVRSACARLRTGIEALDDFITIAKTPRLIAAQKTLADQLSIVLGEAPAGADARHRAVGSALSLVQHELNEAVRAAGIRAHEHDFVDPNVLGNKLPLHRTILEEANTCYKKKCYNACAVLLRRVAEALIIKSFESGKIASLIMNNDGEYFSLAALIGRAQDKKTLNLSRNARSALPRLKFLGDVGAHSTGVLVKKSDLDKAELDVRLAFEELARLI